MLCPFLLPQPGKPHVHLTFAGHSLGGALAALLCCLVRMRLHAPATKLHSFSFGSPPVLSLANGSTASDILQVCLSSLPFSVLATLHQQATALQLSSAPMHLTLITVSKSCSLTNLSGT